MRRVDVATTLFIKRARGIVAANERLIKKLAPILAMRGCLDKCEADELIFEFGGIA